MPYFWKLAKSHQDCNIDLLQSSNFTLVFPDSQKKSKVNFVVDLLALPLSTTKSFVTYFFFTQSNNLSLNFFNSHFFFSLDGLSLFCVFTRFSLANFHWLVTFWLLNCLLLTPMFLFWSLFSGRIFKLYEMTQKSIGWYVSLLSLGS